MEYYSAVKKNERFNMDRSREYHTCELSQREKDKYVIELSCGI